MKLIPDIITYPFSAHSNPFFCALASALLPALGFTEETPFFCGQKDTNCVHCGNCSEDTMLKKHHLRLYHNYQTFTGVSLGWEWPENDSEYQTIPGWAKGWRWPDEFFGFIFGYAGLSWKRLSKDIGKDVIFEAVKTSVDAGQPALALFGADHMAETVHPDVSGQSAPAMSDINGTDGTVPPDGSARPAPASSGAVKPEWRVITGYDADSREIYGFGYGQYEPASIPDWFRALDSAIIITGRAEQSVSYGDILNRMIRTLEHPAHARLESDLAAKLDGITQENVSAAAAWLLEKVSFPIEARWHAADSELCILCDVPRAKDKIFGMIRQYVFDSELDATHGTCWKIWAQIGVGTHTNYALPPNAGELLLKNETRAELKRLFAIVFENDRVVLGLLREAASYYGGGDACAGEAYGRDA